MDMRFRPSPRRVRFFALIGLLFAVPIAAYASVIPALAPPDELGADKFLHAGTFFVFAVLSVLSAASGRWLAFLLGLLVLVGGGIEVAQSLVPGRQGSPTDFLADVAGIAMGTYAATYAVLRFHTIGWDPWLRQ